MPRYVEIQAMAFVNGWSIDEIYEADIDNLEIQNLVRHGLIRIVDDEIRASIPTIKTISRYGGCGCGKK